MMEKFYQSDVQSILNRKTIGTKRDKERERKKKEEAFPDLKRNLKTTKMTKV